MLEMETLAPVADWDKAKREIRKLGIRVTTSLKSCSLGCIGCSNDITEEETALFQTAQRWDSYFGGYLNHQNLTPFQAFKVAEILMQNGIKYQWEKEFYAILIDLDR